MSSKQRRSSPPGPVQDAVIVSAEELQQRRPVSIYRMGKLTSGRGEFLCLVRSISARAFSAQTLAPLSISERVALDFGNERGECTISAIEPDGLAATFDEPIDVATWLDTGAGVHRRAAPRIAIAARARLQIGNQVLFVAARDISQDGIGVVTDDILAEGDTLTVALRGWRGTIPGTIVRVDGEFAAIRFLQPLGFAALSEWLAGRDALPASEVPHGGYEAALS